MRNYRRGPRREQPGDGRSEQHRLQVTKTPYATSKAAPGGKPVVDNHAEGACLACGKQFSVPGGLRHRNTRRRWPPQVRCRTCKLTNDAHYAALENNAPKTAVSSGAKLQAAAPAALLTPDGGLGAPAGFDGASRFETFKRNWLLAAKGLL